MSPLKLALRLGFEAVENWYLPPPKRDRAVGTAEPLLPIHGAHRRSAGAVKSFAIGTKQPLKDGSATTRSISASTAPWPTVSGPLPPKGSRSTVPAGLSGKVLRSRYPKRSIMQNALPVRNSVAQQPRNECALRLADR